MQKFIKKVLGLDIVKTDKGNIGVIKNNRIIQFFYNKDAIEKAEEYIIKLKQLGEI